MIKKKYVTTRENISNEMQTNARKQLTVTAKKHICQTFKNINF
jgi:hypothetical protein